MTLVVTTGEPAGIGPDLVLKLADLDLPVVVAADPEMLAYRAQLLERTVTLHEYRQNDPIKTASGHLTVIPYSCGAPVVPGVLNPANAHYVLTMLEDTARRCLRGEFTGLVTGPVHKGIINDAGVAFTGHTEFFADLCQVKKVVMMLIAGRLRIALATTHLPLRAVPDAITRASLEETITCIWHAYQENFGYVPEICVAGLNPHAGEGGHLGREELDIIIPAMEQLAANGIAVDGPLPADTMFTRNMRKKYDVFLLMYHDQGLPVLKAAGFGRAVNMTLGLPFLRVSVDHGTALDLAGSAARIDVGSMLAAIRLAENCISRVTSA